ncbi:transcriptional regulator [archaeon]|nr:transcriptional regulator [archaeon]|tara:strand:+ start:5717 stop:6442 length:726 start_codon:yes stop_codon:yes gene_type:complete
MLNVVYDMENVNVNKEELSRKIAGEIVLSDTPGKTIKKWREIFHIAQNVLAKKIGVMPSVVSDYENGRRKSPGIKMVHKLVSAMVDIDIELGGDVLKKFSTFNDEAVNQAILDIKEYLEPITINKIIKTTESEGVINPIKKSANGYTVIDSLKAIVNLSPDDLKKIYGKSTERVLVFTNVSTGRSPLIAIKVTNMKPAMVILHGIKKVDVLAQRIAKVEGIGIATTNMDLKSVMKKLRSLE